MEGFPLPPGGGEGGNLHRGHQKRGHVPRIQLLPWEHSTASGLARVCSLHGISRQPTMSGGWSNNQRRANLDVMIDVAVLGRSTPRRSSTPPSCQGLHHRPPRGSAIYFSFNLSPPIRAPGLRAPTPFPFQTPPSTVSVNSISASLIRSHSLFVVLAQSFRLPLISHAPTFRPQYCCPTPPPSSPRLVPTL